jgi:hypothetical protein
MKVHTKSTAPATLRHTAGTAANPTKRRPRTTGTEPIKKLSKQQAKLSKQDLYDMLRQAVA